ncbi:hypothetical protein [Epilithonimonas arachidiradicis]|uniref:Uncharacterized protein n=1 Tax=Epilithonimonas arachidiradicis TaxID=1617282 RepID=A0A420DE02_9FLAO|nr:hypothetical protein [Epilithonimonas arachidiradicis]RKE90022.1 hypothetical protein BXY58_0607 [Epilithonimonas arachidiradicis]GGG47159.1 hypothetical protein GCM10007332_05820 [Epilithonimonas arachidiradicis]
MTLDEFYTAKSKLKAPENLNFLQERNWYRVEVEKLKEQLSKEDLATVNARQNDWQKKVDSSIN